MNAELRWSPSKDKWHTAMESCIGRKIPNAEWVWAAFWNEPLAMLLQEGKISIEEAATRFLTRGQRR